MEIICTILHQVFYNPDNEYAVYSIGTEVEIPNSKYSNETQLYCIKMVGNIGLLSEGAKYRVTGDLVYNNRYNSHQIKAKYLSTEKLESTKDKMAFLTRVTTQLRAETLLSVYPNIIDDVAENPDLKIDFTKTKGIKEKVFETIKKKIIDTYGDKDYISILNEFGISLTHLTSIKNKFSTAELARQEISTNPYILTEISGIGFKKADNIALLNKPDLMNSMFRTIAYVRHKLEEIANDGGDTFVTFNNILKKAKDDIPECKEHLFELLKSDSKIFHIDRQQKTIGLKRYYLKEQSVLSHLLYLKNAKSEWSNITNTNIDDIRQDIKEVEEKQGFAFTEEQVLGIHTIIKNPITCVIGNAGTGKSTVSNGFLNMFAKQGKSIIQCCLSGKAALRLKEINGFYSSTIHRLISSLALALDKNGNPTMLPHDILVIDEASMIGLELFERLITYVSPKTKVIIMGDIGQLDAIGVGNVFKDILNSGLFPVVELTTIHRQAQKSAIISDSIKIRHKKPIIRGNFIGTEVHGELQDLQITSYLESKDTYYHVIKNYMENYEKVGVENIQAVLPMVKYGDSSVYKVNNEIQEYVNPEDSGKKEVKITFKDKYDYIIREGDKVMNVKNNYNCFPNIFNGNIGFVKKIYDGTESITVEEIKYINDIKFTEQKTMYKKCMLIDFTGIGEVYVSEAWYRNIILAYASTCHKLQGSEFDVVVVGIDVSAYKLLSNQWIYTAITRAKKMCYLNCQHKALNMAISNMIDTSKNTYFGEYKTYFPELQ